jgi:uncharacterized membrane protein YgaE (UPF0421/DUF939 family)
MARPRVDRAQKGRHRPSQGDGRRRFCGSVRGDAEYAPVVGVAAQGSSSFRGQRARRRSGYGVRMDVEGRAGSEPTRSRAWAWLRYLISAVRRHRQLSLAARAALAAALAWLAAQPIDGAGADYPYYAPLGAVVAVSATVLSSAREAAQSVVAILLGAGLAIGLTTWAGPNVLTIAAVVVLGTLIGGWRHLGAMSSWVPTAGLFVLIVGDADPEGYVLAYGGLTALGAVIGMGVNLVFPSLPLDAAEASLTRLRDTLARQFDELAEALLAERALSDAEWQERTDLVESVTDDARAAVLRAMEARRANWRARRWRGEARRQYQAAVTLIQLPFMLEDLTAILVHTSKSGESVPWGAPLRPRIAHALQGTADVLRSVDHTGAGDEQLAALDDCLERLVDEVRASRTRTGEDFFGVGSLITTLRRVHDSVRRQERAVSDPS